jgi:hydroxymethylglutaryl-CoA lyase
MRSASATPSASANPRQTRELLETLLATVPADRLAMHMHDTRGTALANCLVGLEMGIRTFDSSVGGLGGCPYAPGASGNLATEDLVYMLHGMGFETGIDLDRLVAAGMLAETLLGRPLPGRALKALAATCTTGPAPLFPTRLRFRQVNS